MQERDMKEEINITNGTCLDFLVLKDLRPDHNLFECYTERHLEKSNNNNIQSWKSVLDCTWRKFKSCDRNGPWKICAPLNGTDNMQHRNFGVIQLGREGQEQHTVYRYLRVCTVEKGLHFFLCVRQRGWSDTSVCENCGGTDFSFFMETFLGMELQRWNEVFAERGRKFLVTKPRLRRLLGLSIIPLSLLLAILKPHFFFSVLQRN